MSKGKTTRAIDAAINGASVHIIWPDPQAMFSAVQRLKNYCAKKGVNIYTLKLNLSAVKPWCSLMPMVGVAVWVDGEWLANEATA